MTIYKYDTLSFKKSKIKISDFLITILLISLVVILISNPTKYANATISGFSLFAMGVFPTLFPFIFISKALSSLETPILLTTKLKRLSHKVFHAPSSIIYVYIMSILCGYPIGAKMTGDLYENGLVTDDQVKHFCCFCSTSGILFVVGTIGTIMFGSPLIGIIIYISHILGSFLGGFILSLKNKKYDLLENNIPKQSSKNLISSSITSSIQSVLVVGAYITVFCLFTQILFDITIFQYLINALNNLLCMFGLPGNLSAGILSGIFEMTNGCKFLSKSVCNSSIVFATGLISFGGISIILQSKTFLQNTKIKARTLVFTKFVHSICSIFICSLILLIF